MSTLYIPLTLAALGIIARGASFAFRKASATLAEQRLYGAFFALSSVLTPFFLGTVAGGIASGRIPPGIAAGNIVTSWLNPTSVLGGVLAVLLCGYLAAVYLCADTTRRGRRHLAEGFRRRALVVGVLTGLVALAGIVVLRADAPTLFTGLTHRAFPLMVLSALAGIISIVLLVLRRYLAVRITAALAVAAVLWGWAVGQYPIMLQPGFTVAEGAAEPTVLATSLIAVAIGAVLLFPSLGWLLRLFQTAEATGQPPAGAAE
jgi:cytochrome d ubiquinol oxidase subunit II